MFRNLSLRNKMLLPICLVTFIAFAITIGFVVTRASQMAEEDAVNSATQVAHRYGGVVKAQVEVAMDAARTLAQAFEGMKNSGRQPDRTTLNEMLKQIMVRNPSFFGVWSVWEPNALDGRDSEFANTEGHDGTGRYVPLWDRYSGRLTFSACGSYDQPGTGDFYIVPRDTGKETIINPYQWTQDGKTYLMTTLSVPVMHKGAVVGVVGIDIALDTFYELVSGVSVYETGYLSILSNNSAYVAHPKAERIGQDMLKTDPWAKNFTRAITSGNGFTTETFSKTVGAEVIRICAPVQLGKTDTPWAVLVSVPESKVFERARKIMYASIVIGLVALLVLMATVFIITGYITRQIRKGVDFAETMAGGDFSQTLSIDWKDEIGILAGALNKMVTNLGGMFKNIASGVETLSSSSAELSAISNQMAAGAEQTTAQSTAVATAAEEMSANMNSVAAAAEQSSTNVTMVATATEEMTATINEIAQSSEKARSITTEAVSHAQNTSDKMRELGDAAKEISHVTEVINDISEQTNLLALNATIEAARAGEAGRGFAVVAGEIKDLAKQTADATREIKTKIDGIQGSTNETVNEIEQISKVIVNINEIVSTIATAVEEQTVTTREISGNVAEASRGIQDVTGNVVQSSAVSGEIAKDIAGVNQAAGEISGSSLQVHASAEELSSLAGQLKEMVEQFKI